MSWWNLVRGAYYSLGPLGVVAALGWWPSLIGLLVFAVAMWREWIKTVWIAGISTCASIGLFLWSAWSLSGPTTWENLSTEDGFLLIGAGILGVGVLSVGIAAFEKWAKEYRQQKEMEAALRETSDSRGSAGVASSADLRQAGLTGTSFGEGIRLGFDKFTGAIIRYTPRDGHGLICAPTGTGKNRDFLTGVLLEWRWSAIVIDPKGALCAITRRQREKLGRVIVLNPFENEKRVFPAKMVLPESSTYNPMALLEPGTPGFTIACERLADGISGDEQSGNENASHFRDKAQDLIAGVIMEVALARPKEQRNLSTVRDIITSANGENLFKFAQTASAPGENFYVAQKLASYGEPNARESKEVDGVISTAKRYTRFIGNETIGPNLCGNGFRFGSLKDTPTTVFPDGIHGCLRTVVPADCRLGSP
jgi:type IV secretory pathway TraG/TraD family ATPase VirD4